jgi:hypothetical protein
MNTYQKLIAEATGITDIEKIDEIEDYMRHIYFHSTLSWQERDVLIQAAKESAQELNFVL